MFTVGPSLRAGAAAPSFPLPYQMTFGASLSSLTALGFVFSPAFSTSNVYDFESVNYPAGADNDPTWTAAPSSGMPTPSGGYYLVIAYPGAGIYTIAVPPTMNARQIAGWAVRGGGGGDVFLRARYDNGAAAGIGFSANLLGYSPFSQLSTGSPPRIPAVPGGATRITQLEVEFTGSSILMLDDITFYA